MDLPDGTVVEYVHDPLGRRIAKKIDAAIVEKYLWQGLTRLLAVYDGEDGLKWRFEYADGRMPLAMTDGSGTRYHLAYDQTGTLRAVFDANGDAVKVVEYDAFGNVITDTAPDFEVPFGFAGGLFDRDTGLVRFGRRDYDPDTGRWTAKDPIGFAGGDTDLYGYVLNDPVNFVDPEGLDSLWVNSTSGMVTHRNDAGQSQGSYPYTSGREGVTDPSVIDQGPIPPGEYTLHPYEISGGDPLQVFIRNYFFGDWGRYRVPLHPNEGTETFGRRNFFLHGGRFDGSAGCVDVGQHDTDLIGPHSPIGIHNGPVNVRVF